MRGKRLIFLISAIVVVVAAVTALVTHAVTIETMREGGEIYIKGDEYEKLMEYFELDDLKKVLDESYYADTEDMNVSTGALKGMVSALGDGYSAFYEEEDFKYFDEKSEGSYIGQGMMLKKNRSTGYAMVSRVFADTPAFDANIQVGDLILEIDGRDTRKIDIDNAVSRLRGLDGTELSLKVRSGDTDMDVTIVRKSPDIEVVFSDMPTPTVGYINILEFSGTSVDDFKKAVDTVTREGAKGIVIDVRGNPGGFVNQAADISNLLLSSGRICYTMSKNGEGSTWNADANILTELPIIVIVDGETQGAAEVFAAALQGNKRAVVIGEKTVGKGVALSFIQVGSSGDGVKLATAEYYTATGEALNGQGVTPDEAVSAGNADNAQEDTMLNRAVELLNSLSGESDGVAAESTEMPTGEAEEPKDAQVAQVQGAE